MTQLDAQASATEERPRKGVKTQLLGVVMIILGFLDSLVSLRVGFALSSFYVFLIAAGALLYALGAVRRGRGA